MLRLIGPAVLAGVVMAGCGLTSASSPGGTGGRLEVVVAENSWGSIVAQLGGSRIQVTSIVANPDTDPHSYEAKPGDARAIARAAYVVANGAGYDPWMEKLAAASPVAGRRQLVIADLLGKHAGDNPHFWYSPDYVARVVDRVTADLGALDVADAAYFDGQNRLYKTAALKGYNDTIEVIRQKYRGTAVGATESVFVYMAATLGLDLVTPPGYMKAVSDGSDPAAADKITVDEQLSAGRLHVLVVNTQNSTPAVQAMVDRARARGIPVTAVTETLAPSTASFQDWQTRQLRSLLVALGG